MTEEITKPFQVNPAAFGYSSEKPETGGEEAFLRSEKFPRGFGLWPAATGPLAGLVYSQSPTPDKRLGELEATIRSAIIALAQGGYSANESAKKILEAAVAPKP